MSKNRNAIQSGDKTIYASSQAVKFRVKLFNNLTKGDVQLFENLVNSEKNYKEFTSGVPNFIVIRIKSPELLEHIYFNPKHSHLLNNNNHNKVKRNYGFIEAICSSGINLLNKIKLIKKVFDSFDRNNNGDVMENEEEGEEYEKKEVILKKYHENEEEFKEDLLYGAISIINQLRTGLLIKLLEHPLFPFKDKRVFDYSRYSFIGYHHPLNGKINFITSLFLRTIELGIDFYANYGQNFYDDNIGIMNTWRIRLSPSIAKVLLNKKKDEIDFSIIEFKGLNALSLVNFIDDEKKRFFWIKKILKSCPFLNE